MLIVLFMARISIAQSAIGINSFIYTPQGCSNPLPGEYFVRLKKSSEKPPVSISDRAQSLINLYGGVMEQMYDHPRLITHGVYISGANEANMQDMLDNESDVLGIEKACLGQVTGVQSNPSWNLDRMDQIQLPLDNQYDFPLFGSSNVHVYVLDNWITGASATTVPNGTVVPATPHNELVGKITEANSRNFIGIPTNNPGCFNHGTPVAGIIAGSTLGIGRSVTLHSFRVADCATNAAVFPSAVMSAIQQILAEENTLDGPVVVNMSFCSDNGNLINSGVDSLIAAGITVVASAGNVSNPGCGDGDDFQRRPGVIAVGGTGDGSISNNRPSSPDSVWSGSTRGNFIDIFSPALHVEVPSFIGTAFTEFVDGTSFSAPHVTGAAAVYLSYNPSASPASVLSAITDNATAGRISGLSAGEPNLLLNTCFLDDSCDTGPVGNPDIFEVDNTPQDASGILNWGTQQHNFDAGDTIDWVSLSMQFSNTYSISTSELGFNADTCISLFDSFSSAVSGGTPIAVNCDTSPTQQSLITFTVTVPHQSIVTYYAKITNQNGFSGDNTDYTLTLIVGAPF